MTRAIDRGRDQDVRPAPGRFAVLAHVLFGIDVLGIVLDVVLVVPTDPTLGTWRSPLLLFALLTVVVGWVLAWRRPRVPIGWLMLAVGLIEFMQGPATVIAVQLRASDPLGAGWAIEFGPESSWTWIPTLGILVGLVPLRFPTGRLPSRRWSWFWWLAVAVLTVGAGFAATLEPSMELGAPNPTFVHWGAGKPVVELVVELALVVVFVGAVVSLFVRYRREGPVERAQLRWLFWALAVVVGLLILGGVENAIFGNEDSGGVAALVAHLIDLGNDLSYSLIPLAILIAVLRSGLYSIDRLISRTAAYALVTLSVVAIYVAVVLVGAVLFPKLQTVGVATATLASAALFLPLLRTLRRAIDRRFDRAQYDAQRVVDAFGERIRAGADPNLAGSDFVAAVQLALQPSAIGIWVRGDGA